MWFQSLNDYNNEKKRIDDEMVDSFMQAADERKPLTSTEAIIAKVKERNSYRWWRLQHDYKWLQKELNRQGVDPHIARELL